LVWIGQYTVSTTSFSCGYSFFYWKYFRKPHKDGRDEYNLDEFGGYLSSSLYIESAKYGSFKEELLYNTDNEITPKIFNLDIVQKSNQYMITKKVRNMRFNPFGWSDNFGISVGTPISIFHIQSLIGYTDFSMLSSSFSSTFRKKYLLETLKAVKNRNKCYYWFSKLFIEAVMGYGRSNPDEVLFCGLNMVLNVSTLNIKLRSPTSTTTQLSVAANFAKEKGIILQFGEGSKAKRFNVSWLSRYKEEEERIMVHGEYPLLVSSIRLTATCTNYQKFCGVLYQITAICDGLRGINLRDRRETKERKEILSSLLSMDRKIPYYISNCFNFYKSTKQTLTINFDEIEEYPKYILDFMFQGDIKMTNIFGSYCVEIYTSNNLLKMDVIQLFPNINRVNINTSYYGYFYQFSLIVFIDNIMKIKKRNKIKFEIYADCMGWGRRSWLFYVSSKISKEQKINGMNIEMDEMKGGFKKDILRFWL